MTRLLRSLLCAVLAMLVATLVAPQGVHASSASLQTVQTMSMFDVSAGDVGDGDVGDHEHKPGTPCDECCQNAGCHLKAALGGQNWKIAFSTRGVRLLQTDFIAAYGAPKGREPDPERG